jgi:AcrR family transcriptional regulator
MSASAGAATPSLEAPPSGPFALLAPAGPSFLLDSPANGRDRFPRELLDRHHRNRVLRGAVASLAERGYSETSVERLIAAAGVSRHTFYAHFTDKEACFLAAYDLAVAWLEQEVATALAAAVDWPGKVAAATGSILTLLAADPGLARLLATEILFIGAAGQARRRALLDRLIPVMQPGRAEQPTSLEPTPRLETALVSGAISVVDREVAAGRGARLADLVPDLNEFLLAPYLGHAEAGRLARRGQAPAR